MAPGEGDVSGFRIIAGRWNFKLYLAEKQLRFSWSGSNLGSTTVRNGFGIVADDFGDGDIRAAFHNAPGYAGRLKDVLLEPLGQAITRSLGFTITHLEAVLRFNDLSLFFFAGYFIAYQAVCDHAGSLWGGAWRSLGLFGVRVLSGLTVSDHIFTGEETSAAERQSTFEAMVKVALETALAT